MITTLHSIVKSLSTFLNLITELIRLPYSNVKSKIESSDIFYRGDARIKDKVGVILNIDVN